jgi:hypothetical protein
MGRGQGWGNRILFWWSSELISLVPLRGSGIVLRKLIVGQYVFRYLSSGKLAAGVSAHPSLATIEEIVGAKGPLQIATAGM